MGVRYIWDTNIAIYYLQQQLPENAELFIDDLVKNDPPFISAMTEIELLCWKNSTEENIVVIRNFIESSMILDLDAAIKTKTVEIRKAHKIKLPDAIIAASALVYDLTLLTRNIKDFQAIETLKLINPWEE
ncbi:type II toxin-antitoxin system VapC family toxin [Mucilaginibacter sp. HMF5004]|uniref:type II toxin-antitoxin system VapC family toxin n=1 Tax=Mucilaginibacter rivuli TaxID=2857527 RepID=UPI001C5F72ED|nr:type II toxin-antitoxin system VapC family toxin [Mucilaginibacter rivuli]MBW4888167.1 type II toxin-antitoxin system VapC family toxin [Mucilaginibacter rivuli]